MKCKADGKGWQRKLRARTGSRQWRHQVVLGGGGGAGPRERLRSRGGSGEAREMV